MRNLVILTLCLVIAATVSAKGIVSAQFPEYLGQGSDAIGVMILVKTPDALKGPTENPVLNKHNIASATQPKLIESLKAMYAEETGKELVYTSYWVANAVFALVTKNMIDKIAEIPEVESVMPNIVMHSFGNAGPEVDDYTVRAEDTYNLARMNVQKVWNELSINGSGVKVGVVDSGLNTNLGFTDGKFVEGKCFKSGEVTTNITDVVGHGTHVCGTIIGGSAKGTLYDMSWGFPMPDGSFDGRIGVAPGAKLYFAKVMGDDGKGDFNDILAGMQWLCDLDGNPNTKDGVRVINVSLGAEESVPEMRQYIKQVTDAGVILVVANGNSGKKCGSPADFPETIAIGATDANDKKASFSSIGPSEFDGQTHIRPDVCAPGVKVISYFKDKLAKLDGTSMACPNACGVVTLMLQANPSLDREGVRSILKSTALDLDVSGPDNNTGWGRIDAYKAVKAALGKQSPLTAQLYALKNLDKDCRQSMERYHMGEIEDTVYLANVLSRENNLRQLADLLVSQRISVDSLISYLQESAKDDKSVEMQQLVRSLKELK
ncbi:MAG: S8 family serine peptidase [Candidatus Wallbacteria bacterium]|nr:S8 family serine peptidase [Candidatus Wallbacteria bacterium]